MKKLAFFGAVAGISIFANLGLELAARYIPSPGFRSLVSFIHCGPGGGQ